MELLLVEKMEFNCPSEVLILNVEISARVRKKLLTADRPPADRCRPPGVVALARVVARADGPPVRMLTTKVSFARANHREMVWRIEIELYISHDSRVTVIENMFFFL